MFEREQKIRAAIDAFLSDIDGNSQDCLSGLGPIRSFEKKLCELCGVRHAVLVNNATNGLLAIGLSLGLVNGSIIAPRISYGATYGPFELLGNQLLYATTGPDDLIEPASVERLFKTEKKIGGVIGVDLNGHSHDMFALRKICDRFSVPYIADAAQSLGAFLHGHHASSKADAWVVSFGPGKTLCCGEGGAVLTNLDSIYENLIYFSQHPCRYRREFSLTNFTERQPFNGRIHPLAAVIGNVLIEELLSQRPMIAVPTKQRPLNFHSQPSNK